MKSCIACSMPLEGAHAGDTGCEVAEGPVCIHCSAGGKMKSAEEIYEGGVQFFMQAVPGTARGLAERLTRRNMKSLPYWQKHPSPVLDGEVATEEEHNQALGQL